MSPHLETTVALISMLASLWLLPIEFDDDCSEATPHDLDLLTVLPWI